MIFRFISMSILVCSSLWAYDSVSMAGRLVQARLQFEERNYSEALILLAPLLNSKDSEVLTLAAHCEFELGNYLAAAEHFKMLSDPTSLYRMVQLEDRFNNFPELEKYYQRIISPPDFVRYIHARQLFLNGYDARALPELDLLMTSPDYEDRATYIKAAVLARQGQIDQAVQLLTGLSGSLNSELAQLAKLTKARLLYEQDQVEKSIALYETLNYPDELAWVQLRAGDLSPDLKKAQSYYQAAERHASDLGLKSDILIREDKNDEARVYLKANQDNVLATQKKIAENNPELFMDPWVLAQPEVAQLWALQNKIAELENLWNDTNLEYEIFKIDLIDEEFQEKLDKFKQANLLLTGLRVELRNLKENYADTSKRALEEAKPVWLAKLDERIHEADQVAIRSGAGERLKLRNRIAQIEQTKAAELRRAEEAFKP